MRQWSFTGGLALSLVFLSCAARDEVRIETYDEGVHLRYKPIEGRELCYDLRSTISSTTELGGDMSQVSVTSTSFEIKRQVEKVAGDTVVLKISFEQAEGWVKVGTQSMPVPGLDGLKGEYITLTIVEGKVVDEKVSGDLGDEIGQYIEGIASDIEEEFTLFSGKKLSKPGEEWDLEREEDGKSIKTHWMLEGLEERGGFKCAKLRHSSEIDLVEEQTQMGMEVKFTGKGEEKGETYFALEEGYKVYEKNSASIEGKTDVPAMGQSFNVYTDVSVELELVPGEGKSP